MTAGSGLGSPRRTLLVAGAALLVVAVLVLYRPVLGFALRGDDYQFLQLAHAAAHDPVQLLGDIDEFYRPSTTWLLVVDRWLWGQWASGYFLTSLLLRCVSVLMLIGVGVRLGLSRLAAWILAALWAVSPLTQEPLVRPAIRLQELLLISWLGLILSWPRSGQRWNGRRIAVVGLWTLLAATSKETWVMTPVLAAALELARGQRRLKNVLWVCTPFLMASVLFVVVRFLVFPGDRGYFVFDGRILAKVCHQLAAFLWLELPVQIGFSVSWRGVLAVFVVALLVVLGVRKGRPATVVGATLLTAPMVPTLAVPLLPFRYTMIPYAGFLLVVVDWIVALVSRLEGRRRTVAVWGACLFAVLSAAGSIAVLRADLVDHRRVSDAHRRLLEEAASVADELPLDRPVLVVRIEREDPLAEIALSPRGLAKIYFPRHRDPYGLIDTAALFEWTLGREDVAFVRLGEPPEGVGDVLLHRAGRFEWDVRRAPDLSEEARRWRAHGFPVRTIRAHKLR